MSLKIYSKNAEKFKDFVVLNSDETMKLSPLATLLDLGPSTLSRWQREKVYKEQAAEVKKLDEEELSEQVEKLKLKYAIGLLFRQAETLNKLITICVCLETGQIMNPKENTHKDIYRILENTARTANLGVINFIEKLVSGAEKVKEGT